MEEMLLQAEGINFSYNDGKRALSNINLSVKKGEKIAVLGSNGAGKSTCFLTLNGVLRPQSGKIYYQGKEIQNKNLNELRKHVGIVFQEADNQIIASTVSAEISFGPMNLKLPKQEVKRRVEHALDCMNLTDLKDRPPHYLSGGEKKRVSIADIIAMESQVILFDEPTSSLDPVNVKMLEQVLDQLTDMGKTLLISTHNVDFAYRWADRGVVFSDGSIIGDGTIRQIFEDKALLNKANLKEPILLQVYHSMVKHGKFPEVKESPKDMLELNKLLEIY